VLDAMRLRFSKGFGVEAVPDKASYDLPKRAGYRMSVTTTEDSFTMQRQFAMSEIIVPTTEYAELRGFYNQLESKDQESVVLKVAPVEAASAATGTTAR
jgi:hypothetical protein